MNMQTETGRPPPKILRRNEDNFGSSSALVRYFPWFEDVAQLSPAGFDPLSWRRSPKYSTSTGTCG